VKKTILRYAIALDLVVIATGAALLLPGQPWAILATYLAAVAAAAWTGGRGAGAATSISSLVILGFLFGNVIRPEHFVLFSTAGAILSLALPRLRETLTAAPVPVEPSPPVVEQAVTAAPGWLVVVVPLVLLMVYTDLSEVLIETLGVPSLLQPMIVGLAGLAWFYRAALRPLRIVFHPVTLTLAGYCALLFVSSLWARDPWLTDEQVVGAVKNFLVYVVIAIFAASWPALQNGLRTLALVAAALATISIVQIIGGVTNELGGLATLSYGNIYAQESDARAAGPVGDANFYGQILILVVPLALYLAWVAGRKRERLFWLAVSAVISGGVLVTYSRGAMLGLAVMAGLVLIALRVPLLRVAAASGVVVMLLILAPGNVGKRFTTMISLLPQETYYVTPDASIERRRLIAGSALRMFDEHLLLGVGAGNFGTNYAHYANQSGSPADLFYEHGEVHREHAHSLYLEIAAENGIAGLLIFAGVVLLSYAELRRAHKLLPHRGISHESLIALALSAALSGFLVTSVFLHSSSQRYLFLLFALITALSCIATDARPIDDRAGAAT
jgi:putative inorganic carbon (hco3(-)) transporter